MEYDIMTQGDMTSDQIWGEEPPTCHFRSLPIFMNFYSAIQKELDHVINNTMYDSVSTLCHFYHQFKEQSLPFDEFYSSYRATMSPDAQNCLGISIGTRRRFISKLADQFPFLNTNCFMVSGSGYPTSKLPESFKDCPAKDTGRLKVHGILALKIKLESNRDGFILFEAAYGMGIPIVVMDDELPPHTGRFWVRGSVESRYNHFRKLKSSNYIQWQCTKSFDEQDPQEPRIYRWFYVGRKLINVKELDKRNRLEYFHAYIRNDSEGVRAGFYKMMERGEELIFFQSEKENDRFMTMTPVNFRYFSQENKDPEIEELLAKVAQQMRQDLKQLKLIVRKFCTVLQDAEFLKTILKIDKEYTEYVNDSFSNNSQ